MAIQVCSIHAPTSCHSPFLGVVSPQVQTRAGLPSWDTVLAWVTAFWHPACFLQSLADTVTILANFVLMSTSSMEHTAISHAAILKAGHTVWAGLFCLQNHDCGRSMRSNSAILTSNRSWLALNFLAICSMSCLDWASSR